MASRSLNKVLLIGNVVRDPEIRFTAQNTAVGNFSIATNRTWNDANGQAQEETEYSRVVVWGKLAEIVGQIIQKGRKVYVEGRLRTRDWETKEGQKRQSTEIVAENVIALDSRGGAGMGPGSENGAPATGGDNMSIDDTVTSGIDDLADDIPF